MKEFNLSFFELLEEIYKKKFLFIFTNLIILFSSFILTQNYYKENYKTEISISINTSKNYIEKPFLTLNIDSIKKLKSIEKNDLSDIVFLEDGSLVSQYKKKLSSKFIKKVINKDNFENWNKNPLHIKFSHLGKNFQNNISKKIFYKQSKNNIKFIVLSKDKNYIKEFHDYLKFTKDSFYEDNINKINIIINNLETKIDKTNVVSFANLNKFKNDIRKFSELHVFKNFLIDENFDLHNPEREKRINLNPIYINLLSVIIWSFLFMFFLIFYKYISYYKKLQNEN